MSVTIEDFTSRMQTGHDSVTGIGEELAAWVQIGLGALALCLYVFLLAITESLGLVLIGPFVLVGMSRLMGLRSLWYESSAVKRPQDNPNLGLVGCALRSADTQRSKQWTAMALLESALGEGQSQLVIDDLKAEIGRAGKKYAKSAYLIARRCMQVGQYAEAREWLRKSAGKGEKPSLPVEMLRANLSTCNVQLLAEGDACYEAGDFQRARERYAQLSRGLEQREEKRLAIFLRSACVYCRLGEYESARQAVLQALKTDQEADNALVLLDLLQRLLRPEDEAVEQGDASQRIEKQLADHVAGVMDELRAQIPGLEGPSDRF